LLPCDYLNISFTLAPGECFNANIRVSDYQKVDYQDIRVSENYRKYTMVYLMLRLRSASVLPRTEVPLYKVLGTEVSKVEGLIC